MSKILEKSTLETYTKSLVKTVKKALEDGKFNFIVIDSSHRSVSSFNELYGAAQSLKYEPMVIEMSRDIGLCEQRLEASLAVLKCPLSSIQATKAELHLLSTSMWELLPEYMSTLDISWLLHGGDTQECDMEDASGDTHSTDTLQRKLADADEDDNDEDDNEIAKPANMSLCSVTQLAIPKQTVPLKRGFDEMNSSSLVLDNKNINKPIAPSKGVIVHDNAGRAKKTRRIKWSDPIDDGGDGGITVSSVDTSSSKSSKWDGDDDDDDDEEGDVESRDSYFFGESRLMSKQVGGKDVHRGFEIGAVTAQKQQENKRLQEQARQQQRSEFLRRVQEEQRLFRAALKSRGNEKESSEL